MIGLDAEPAIVEMSEAQQGMVVAALAILKQTGVDLADFSVPVAKPL
jgi:hypothetical protein